MDNTSLVPRLSGALHEERTRLQNLGEKVAPEFIQQKKAILAVYEWKDVFVSLPTGFGKSICFQILPFVFAGR